jgi:hypothetical protein
VTPLSLLAAQAFLSKLTNANALQQQLTMTTAGLGISVPTIGTAQVILSSAAANLADNNIQLSYPRVCIYSTGLKNNQLEKFRSFSGQVMVTAEIWASGDLVTDVDTWIHFYVESVAAILQRSIGDWGNGMFYAGAYDVQFQPPKTGGLGFVVSAKLSFTVNVSMS